MGTAMQRQGGAERGTAQQGQGEDLQRRYLEWHGVAMEEQGEDRQSVAKDLQSSVLRRRRTVQTG